MGYSDPTSSRDLLGNRSLLFIFICAFALVTLLQQILYGRNYLKSGLQFSWQSGEETANWTGSLNFTDGGALKSGTDPGTRYFEFYEGPFDYNSTKCLELRQDIIEVKVLSMVKQTELFERWRNLQKNTPLGTKLKYEVDSSGIFHINQEIFRMFPKEMPHYRSQFKKCAVVGNGGILKNSRCGQEIDRADFVFRCNLPPISEKYAVDVGVKTDIVTVNPSIITERFHKLEKWRKPFYEVLQAYENASVLLPAFYNTRNTDVSVRVKYVLDDFESQQAIYFFHPQYLINVSRYWLTQGVRAKRVSTGLILVTAALELCEEVHLFGFWAFPMNPSGVFITHHYYDNVKPRPGFHAMPSEIFNFLHMHSKGILRVHTDACS
ncbi:alpha-2,8-sialyltransferase 8E isoform X2 [Paroedura picta]|uniref:alpha-2,8-sialyltransferase 8E isoform X2 n=1 Tax=Paroedura picta TaxID=143630 RepID=UPI004055A59E